MKFVCSIFSACAAALLLIPCHHLSAQSSAATIAPKLPEIQREFRAVWVATVANIDWPSRKGLSTAEQQSEFIAILDKCVELNMNAVVLQVRPAADAIYESRLEPWSAVLTGVQGQAPEPFYDPLSFAVAEAHKRGIELHCWFNPYRAGSNGTDSLDKNHQFHKNPKIVKEYGKYLWLDPAAKETQDHSLAVMLDVVKRYDIDGIHMDDYFYPYPSYADGKDFPDDESWAEYQKSGGKLSRPDFRRDAVNKFVERLYKEVKAEKKHVKVGISPFGIARPGIPKEVAGGFDQFADLYADAQLWLNEGWVDYYTPQLYWKIASAQPYPYLVKYWLDQNTKNRHIWPGLYTSKFAANACDIAELSNQVVVTRAMGAGGNVHFSMKAFMTDEAGMNEAFTSGSAAIYNKQALVPATPWLDDEVPTAPKVEIAEKPESADATTTSGPVNISWSHSDQSDVFLTVVYSYYSGAWVAKVYPEGTTTATVANAKGVGPTQVAVSAVDRIGNESEKTIVKMGEDVVEKAARPAVDQVQ